MLRLNSRYDAIYRTLPPSLRDCAGSAYAWWSARKKYGAAFSRWSEFLRESQWWDAKRLEEYQADRTGELLQFAAEASPFYKEWFLRHGVRPESSDPLEALRRLPVIDRSVLREHHGTIKTRFAEDARLTLTTSGTSGASLHVPHTLEALQREYAFRWQFYSMGDARRGDRFALFQGHMVVPMSQGRPPYHIRNFVERTIMFSLYHMSDDTMSHYVKALAEFRPDFIYGYPSGIFVLARFALSTGLKLPRVRAVFTASEMLHDVQRETIESAFGTRVFQWYGQVETTANLHECPQHRLHVKEEYGLLEILDDHGAAVKPGEVGRVIATGWGNKAFPLLRYHTGDNMILAADQGCSCGRGGRIIERIMGRDDDFVITPEGRFVGRLDFVFKAVDSVKESQIVQEDETNITILVVPRADFCRRDEEVIVQKLQERIGLSMKVIVKCVDGIPRSGGGKFRYVVSKVKFKYGQGTSDSTRATSSSETDHAPGKSSQNQSQP